MRSGQGQDRLLKASFGRGALVARLAVGPDEVAAAQRLRHRAFFGAGEGGAHRRGAALDIDAHDQTCEHLLVLDGEAPVACCRLRLFRGGAVLGSYSAQFYDLSAMTRYPQPMLEIGRFCLDPMRHDPDILRLAWAAMARIVDSHGVGLMFGCSSFAGADPARHGAALAVLRCRIGPAEWRPRPLAPERLALSGFVPPHDPGQALVGLPPLLRSYLGMGGWVSDHAVVDRTMNTLHVFTGVEVASIPAARAKALRLLARECMG